MKVKRNLVENEHCKKERKESGEKKTVKAGSTTAVSHAFPSVDLRHCPVPYSHHAMDCVSLLNVEDDTTLHLLPYHIHP